MCHSVRSASWLCATVSGQLAGRVAQCPVSGVRTAARAPSSPCGTVSVTPEVLSRPPAGCVPRQPSPLRHVLRQRSGQWAPVTLPESVVKESIMKSTPNDTTVIRFLQRNVIFKTHSDYVSTLSFLLSRLSSTLPCPLVSMSSPFQTCPSSFIKCPPSSS